MCRITSNLVADLHYFTDCASQAPLRPPRRARCAHRSRNLLSIVAIRASPGRRVVEDDALTVDIPCTRVAFVARHLGMGALQRKIRLCLVIKKRRLPSFRVVARSAILRLSPLQELTRMDVGVARCTGGRRRFEGGLCELASRSFRLVALFALDPGVSPNQREGSFGMIEAWKVGPGFHVVACFAPFGASVGTSLRHPLIEFAAMWIMVAARAGAIAETVARSLRIRCFVAG